jgi:hypothetical protein
MILPRSMGGPGMKRILVIALSALMLAGCVAEWKSNRTGPRWKEGPGTSAPPDIQSGTAMTP